MQVVANVIDEFVAETGNGKYQLISMLQMVTGFAQICMIICICK